MQCSLTIQVSYLEIYNELVRDLFRPAGRGSTGNSAATTLRVREDPQTGAYVEGLAEVTVTSYAEVSSLLC
jgi:kinesin family member 1